jgi:quinol monooxygenase YgiN
VCVRIHTRPRRPPQITHSPFTVTACKMASDAPPSVRRDLLVATMAILGTLSAVHAHRAFASTSTTTGRPKAVGEKAFVLSVGLQFRDSQAADEVISAWRVAAEACLTREPFLYAYEFAQSEDDPLRYVILERYRSKDDYTGPHRSSAAFKKFRPKLRALQESGRVQVSGSSYRELGIGFT